MNGLLFWRFRVRMGYVAVYTCSGVQDGILHSRTSDMVTRLSSNIRDVATRRSSSIRDVATRRSSLSVLLISTRGYLAEMIIFVWFFTFSSGQHQHSTVWKRIASTAISFRIHSQTSINASYLAAQYNVVTYSRFRKQLLPLNPLMQDLTL